MVTSTLAWLINANTACSVLSVYQRKLSREQSQIFLASSQHCNCIIDDDLGHGESKSCIIVKEERQIWTLKSSSSRVWLKQYCYAWAALPPQIRHEQGRWIDDERQEFSKRKKVLKVTTTHFSMAPAISKKYFVSSSLLVSRILCNFFA